MQPGLTRSGLAPGPPVRYPIPVMPVATPAQYRAMLDAAQKGGYAYPAINVTSITTINGLRAFAESKSDGIIQVSTGGGEFAAGTGVKDAAFGAIVLAEACHRLAEKYDVLIALHTDHCHPAKVDGFLKPLLQASRERIAAGKGPLFQSHMFDGSVVRWPRTWRFPRSCSRSAPSSASSSRSKPAAWAVRKTATTRPACPPRSSTRPPKTWWKSMKRSARSAASSSPPPSATSTAPTSPAR
jgi:hypothetical protein